MKDQKTNATLEQVTEFIKENVTLINGVAHWARDRGVHCKAGREIKGDVISAYYRLYSKREVVLFLKGDLDYYLSEEVSSDGYREAKKEIERRERAIRGEAIRERAINAPSGGVSLVSQLEEVKAIVTEIVETGSTYNQIEALKSQIEAMGKSLDAVIKKMEMVK